MHTNKITITQLAQATRNTRKPVTLPGCPKLSCFESIMVELEYLDTVEGTLAALKGL